MKGRIVATVAINATAVALFTVAIAVVPDRAIIPTGLAIQAVAMAFVVWGVWWRPARCRDRHPSP